MPTKTKVSAGALKVAQIIAGDDQSAIFVHGDADHGWNTQEELAAIIDRETQAPALVEALKHIANLWPPPPNCADVMNVVGPNDGKQRAILLDAALKISRKALTDAGVEL